MSASTGEVFSPRERALLAPYVSTTEGDVFALRNLPEVTKGALFARYSRSSKSLRRLLLDEFLSDEDQAGTLAPAAVGSQRAERLYQRVLVEYGDDSVAQLGGAHVAVEQVSNLVSKVLEWGRLAAYLEQSTRYMPYDGHLGGRYRYHRPQEIMRSPLAGRFERDLDAVFDAYAAALPSVRQWLEHEYPRDETTGERAYRNAITAKACDLLRGLLPAATTSNLGIYASGQAFEQLLLRLRSHDLAEARTLGDQLLTQLRTVIPAFLERVDRPERGGRWSQYLADTRAAARAIAGELLAGTTSTGGNQGNVPEVQLVAYDPDAETDLIVGMLYPHTHLPENQIRARVERMSDDERMAVVRAYVGERQNRRHKPGRALERVSYRFDICGDYGAFRDLQRHRMMTIEWQEPTCRHGYDTPPELQACGVAADWHRALERQAALWHDLSADLPWAAAYAVGFAWRVRYSIQLNARAAMHMLELRTSPQGHASYRRVTQRMHRLIAEQAGHRAVASMMSFVDHSGSELERLEAERRGEARQAAFQAANAS